MAYATNRSLALLIFLSLALIAPTSQAEEPKQLSTARFEYAAPGGTDLRFVVTPDGLARIELAGALVAEGKWQAQDFSTLMDFQCNYDWRKARKDAAWAYKEKRLEQLDAAHARVTHRAAEVEAVYDYRFSGEDVEVCCTLKNLTAEAVFQAVKFSGLVFHFDRAPTGLFSPLAVSYPGQIIPTCRAANFHPCFGAPCGGSELSDDRHGIGATPLRTGWSPTVLAWEGYKAKDVALQYVRGVTVTPGSAVRCDFLLRASKNRDWRHLLEPYRRHFRATFGGVRYANSNRPLGYIQGTSDKWIKPGNPFGYGGKYRFDTEAGVKTFIDETLPMLQRAAAQGLIVWSFTPYNPRGCNFRPDTDALPPEVWRQLPTLTAAFQRAGLGLGICMRPQIVTTYDWEHDMALTLHPDDLSQLGLAIRPFNRLMKEGMNTFYLDTFGGGPNDARTMKFLRDMWGDRRVFTCTEFWSDVSLLYSPGYTQYNWDKNAQSYREFWRREHLWEVCQWLAPGVQLASPQGVWDAKNPRPAGTPDPFRYLYQQHVIPIFFTATRTSAEMADQLRDLTREFLNDKGEFVK